MDLRSKNEALMDAISRYSVKEVKTLLDEGADPNYARDHADEPNGYLQPDTPLCLVVFRISDCMLDDADLNQFAKIASLLIKKGADPVPALQLAESRYGKDDPTVDANSFLKVWRIIANGK